MEEKKLRDYLIKETMVSPITFCFCFLIFLPSLVSTQSSNVRIDERVKEAFNQFQTGDVQESLKTLDSIKQVVLKSNEHIVFLQAIKYQATIHMVTGNQDSAILCYQEGITHAKEIEDVEEELNFHLNEIALRRMRNEEGNKPLILSLIRKAENHPREKSMLLQELSCVHEYTLNHVDSAVYYQNEALKLAEEIQDSNRIASILGAMGETYRKQGAYLMSVDYSLRSLQYIQNPLSYFQALNNISTSFYQLQQFDKTKQYINEAMEYAKTNNLKRGLAMSQYTLGTLAYQNHETELAKSYFSHAMPYYDSRPLHDGRASVRIGLLRCYLDLSQLDSAQYCLDQMQAYYDRLTDRYKGRFHFAKGLLLNSKEAPLDLVETEYMQGLEFVRQAKDARVEIDILKALQELFSSHNPSKALSLSNMRETLNDSLFESTKTQMLFDLEARYQKGEQDKQIASLDATNQINSLKLQAKNRQMYLLVGGLLGLLIIAFMLYRNARIRRKTNQQLNQKNTIISNALEEKDTLLREIHHRVKNNLQVISSLLALQSKYIKDDSALDALKQGQDRVQSMALIHQDLYQADNLKGVDTQSYFQQLAENLFESYRIDEDEIRLELDVEPLMLDVDTMIPLGLVLNELVSNALKHAFADQRHGEIKVTLKEEDDHLLLEVEDNGTGIDDLNVLEGRSFGFELVKAFAQKLKADIQITKEPGLGIRLEINEYKKAA